jgi:chromosome segregation ATPase
VIAANSVHPSIVEIKTNKDQELQQRLKELEAEIEKLKHEAQRDNDLNEGNEEAYANSLKRLAEMKEEKELLQKTLAANTQKLQQQEQQIQEQRQMILEQKQRLDALLLKFESKL